MKASEVVKTLHGLMEQGEGDPAIVINHEGKYFQVTTIIRRTDNELPGQRPPSGGIRPPEGGTEPSEGTIEIQTEGVS